MKKIILILCGLFIWQAAFGQVTPARDRNESGFMRDVSSDGTTTTYSAIHNRSYASGVTDTTEWYNIVNHKTIDIALTTKDSATILIDYAVSVDANTWSAYTLKDSLQFSTDGANGFKSVDFSSTALGFSYIKFRFRSSANAFPLGTTSPTYSAIYTFKKD